MFIIFIVLSIASNAQTIVKKTWVLNENTVVIDSAGVRYPYVILQRILSTGYYKLRKVDPGNDSSAFVLYKITDAERTRSMAFMPATAESHFFKTGEKITSFVANDINGNKIKLKSLEGKVVVLNFWFIGCPPCRQEIPELNNLALQYGNNPDIVFIAICLDYKADIEEFLKDKSFSYHIVAEGREYADLYRLNLYPTNVVLDKEGKVRFHASGYAVNTPYWIKKTIEEVK